MMLEPSKPIWEVVHTMDGYYDGPISGITNHAGIPHFYQAQWNELEAQYDHYRISPVNGEVLKLALESWALWNRWGFALTNGSAIPETLILEQCRYQEIQNSLQEFLIIDPVTAKRVYGEFRAAPERVSEPYLEVLWTAA